MIRSWLAPWRAHWIGAALWVGAAGLIATPAAKAAPPAEQFFQAGQIASAQLSPNGQRIAFISTAKGGRGRLVVLDLRTMKPGVAVAYQDADVNRFQWVNDERLVFEQSVELTGPGRIDFGHGLAAANHDGSGFRALVQSTNWFFKDAMETRPLLPPHTRLLHGAGRQDGDDVYVLVPEQANQKSGVDFIKLLRLNTVTGRSKEVDAPLHVFDWLMDKDGTLRVVETRQAQAGALRYLQADGQWKTLLEFDARDPASGRPRPLELSPDGRLFVSAPSPTGTAAVYTMDLANGKLGDAPVLVSKEFDLAPDFVASDERLLGMRYTVDAEVTHWLDPQMKAHQATIDAMLPSTTNRLSAARRPSLPYMLVEAYSDRQAGLFLLYNTETRKLIKLGAVLPDLDTKALGQTDFVHYKARDGLEIPAYLTLPPVAEKRQLPMVVLVHGGPYTRGRAWGWDREVQFLASRGYAVLQPEFRGGRGFGFKHFQAGWKQWGQAMQDDIADGVRWAAAQGYADPKRVCIAGASYGGYAVLMGLIRDPDLYRCGFEWVGVTDIQLMYDVSWSDTTEDSKTYGMPKLIGDPVGDAAMLAAASPLAQAARLKRPLLMAYGAFDIRVPIVHGEKFHDAVKVHNPDVEWLVYPKEGHGWQHPETNIDFWTRVEKFLDRHIGH
jgi:dipeptidyl aminopeptidase/acylaminoacyl peptidase